jgi:hypothetical protein
MQTNDIAAILSDSKTTDFLFELADLLDIVVGSSARKEILEVAAMLRSTPFEYLAKDGDALCNAGGDTAREEILGKLRDQVLDLAMRNKSGWQHYDRQEAVARVLGNRIDRRMDRDLRSCETSNEDYRLALLVRMCRKLNISIEVSNDEADRRAWARTISIYGESVRLSDGEFESNNGLRVSKAIAATINSNTTTTATKVRDVKVGMLLRENGNYALVLANDCPWAGPEEYTVHLHDLQTGERYKRQVIKDDGNGTMPVLGDTFDHCRMDEAGYGDCPVCGNHYYTALVYDCGNGQGVTCGRCWNKRVNSDNDNGPEDPGAGSPDTDKSDSGSTAGSSSTDQMGCTGGELCCCDECIDQSKLEDEAICGGEASGARNTDNCPRCGTLVYCDSISDGACNLCRHLTPRCDGNGCVRDKNCDLRGTGICPRTNGWLPTPGLYAHISCGAVVVDRVCKTGKVRRDGITPIADAQMQCKYGDLTPYHKQWKAAVRPVLDRYNANRSDINGDEGSTAILAALAISGAGILCAIHWPLAIVALAAVLVYKALDTGAPQGWYRTAPRAVRPSTPSTCKVYLLDTPKVHDLDCPTGIVYNTGSDSSPLTAALTGASLFTVPCCNSYIGEQCDDGTVGARYVTEAIVSTDSLGAARAECSGTIDTECSTAPWFTSKVEAEDVARCVGGTVKQRRVGGKFASGWVVQ